MANQKISQLTSGIPAQAADQIPINRSGANFSITAGSILSSGIAAVKASTRVTSGINALGNVTGAGVVIDLSLGNVVTMTLTGNVTSSSFSNASASTGQEITFIITQDGTGGRTFTWPAAVVPTGIAPYPTLTANSVSVFKGVVDGSGNVNFVTNGGVTVYRNINSSVTTSNVSNEVIYVPPALGRYRATAIVSTITTDAGAPTMSVTTQFNNGNVSNVNSSTAVGSGLFGSASASFSAVVYSLSGNTCAMGWKTTLSGTIGTAVFQVDYIVEFLGT